MAAVHEFVPVTAVLAHAVDGFRLRCRAHRAPRVKAGENPKKRRKPFGCSAPNGFRSLGIPLDDGRPACRRSFPGVQLRKIKWSGRRELNPQGWLGLPKSVAGGVTALSTRNSVPPRPPGDSATGLPHLPLKLWVPEYERSNFRKVLPLDDRQSGLSESNRCPFLKSCGCQNRTSLATHYCFNQNAIPRGNLSPSRLYVTV